MVFEVKSTKSLDQIGRDIADAASRHKFGVLTVHDLQKKMQEKGIQMDREVRIFEVCNPKQAKEVIEANPTVSTALPCRISVYREGEGYTLSTLRPTDTMKAFDDASIDDVAKQVEVAMIAIMKEAAG
ncbi:MAG: DUF302 domain-containing protein [Acidobacteria bacterium]|nr:DUF302 domain-containing protein [Acidobacteriota bacterium]